MENAVKALLIAAGVLLGVMILSLAVSLYASLGGYIEQAQQEAENKELQQFNEQFLKYINCNDNSGGVEFVLKIQDIVTAANSAYENNKKYELTEQNGSNYYVTINIKSEITNLEKTINTNSVAILSQETLQKSEYKCTPNDVKINSLTGRVYEVNFSKITP